MTKDERKTLSLLTKFCSGRITYSDEEIKQLTVERLEICEAAQRDSYGGARFGEAPITKFRRR